MPTSGVPAPRAHFWCAAVYLPLAHCPTPQGPGLADHADHAELKFLRSGTAGCAGASARPAGPRILRTFASSVAEARHRREHLPPSASDLVFGARVLLPEGQ